VIEFGWPWALLFLPLPLVVYWLLPKSDRQDAALRVPFYHMASGFEGEQVQVRRSRVRRLVMILCWLALVCAATRPEWIGEQIELPTSGRDLMLAVDISGSMGQDDMQLDGEQVSRLHAVKVIAGSFIETRIGDRLGLILFGTKPYVQTPLTFDRNTVRQLLEETPLGIAGGKTAVGDAIGLAVKRLQSRPAESRVLVLLTDGRNNIGELSPLQAANIAAQEGVRIYTIGFGADEMLIPGFFGTRRVNPSAELDTDTLTRIAEETGGLFRRARTTEELQAIYKELDELEPIDQETETYRPEKSLFAWPLGFAVLTSLALGLLHPAFLGLLAGIFRRKSTALLVN
jgi:Ca-activated chloride channel family protein